MSDIILSHPLGDPTDKTKSRSIRSVQLTLVRSLRFHQAISIPTGLLSKLPAALRSAVILQPNVFPSLRGSSVRFVRSLSLVRSHHRRLIVFPSSSTEPTICFFFRSQRDRSRSREPRLEDHPGPAAADASRRALGDISDPITWTRRGFGRIDARLFNRYVFVSDSKLHGRRVVTFPSVLFFSSLRPSSRTPCSSINPHSLSSAKLFASKTYLPRRASIWKVRSCGGRNGSSCQSELTSPSTLSSSRSPVPSIYTSQPHSTLHSTPQLSSCALSLRAPRPTSRNQPALLPSTTTSSPPWLSPDASLERR